MRVADADLACESAQAHPTLLEEPRYFLRERSLGALVSHTRSIRWDADVSADVPDSADDFAMLII